MNWWKINGFLMLIGSSLFAQIPVDTSYTLASTVEKIRKQYPGLTMEGVVCSYPESVARSSVHYKQLGERRLAAHLFLPRENERAIGILLIHGGGWRTGNPKLMFPLAERIAASGYSVMVPEYRLSLEAQYPAAVEDLREAIHWMRSHTLQLSIDANQLVVMGCSAGGQLAALLGTTQSVQAIIDVDGVLAFKHPDSQEGEMAAQWLGGDYPEVPEIWTEASALTHVNEATPPTLFLASSFPRFLAGHKEYMAVLEKAGTYVDVKYLKAAPHSFWLLTPWFDETVGHTLAFLNHIFNN